MTIDASAWPLMVRFIDVARRTTDDPLKRHIVLSETTRRDVARELELEGLGRLEADIRISAWRDGLRIEADWSAEVTQICGVSLDPFDSALTGAFVVEVVPFGSEHAPAAAEPELVIDLEDDDPPDVIEGDTVDVGAYVVEHLALEIDPFPRKPGAEFQPPEPLPEASPFAVLRAIKPRES
jgi:uncharacterized metal-binding protein YceD (DUF177 family)